MTKMDDKEVLRFGAAVLVLDHGLNVSQVSSAFNAAPSTVRGWVSKLKKKRISEDTEVRRDSEGQQLTISSDDLIQKYKNLQSSVDFSIAQSELLISKLNLMEKSWELNPRPNRELN